MENYFLPLSFTSHSSHVKGPKSDGKWHLLKFQALFSCHPASASFSTLHMVAPAVRTLWKSLELPWRTEFSEVWDPDPTPISSRNWRAAERTHVCFEAWPFKTKRSLHILLIYHLKKLASSHPPHCEQRRDLIWGLLTASKPKFFLPPQK